MAVINLTPQDDNFSDNNAGNRINAFAGDDSVRGNGGGDTINGGRGADTLQGGEGADRLFDLAPEDVSLTNRLNGGPGNDLLSAGSPDDIGVVEAFGGDGDDRLVASDAGLLMRGGAGDDDIEAFASFNGEVSGDGGDDTLFLQLNELGGFDVDGGAGLDAIELVGLQASGRADGGGGDDTIDARGIDDDFGSTYSGGEGDDTIYGANAFDEGVSSALVGGGGTDLLVANTGDLGSEFRFAAGDLRGGGNRDVIRGFDPATDTIDVSAIDADPDAAGDQAFAFLGESAAVEAGELAYAAAGRDTIIRLDFANGVRSIELEGYTGPVGEDDFVL